ncbi:MAG TPA: endolytic transglycosylase MltG [Streptosporangiaceae bacterium]
MAPWIAALVILTPIAVGGFYAYSFYQSKYHPADFAGTGYGSVLVEVKSGDTATSLAPELLNSGVIASDRAFVLAAEHSTNTQGLVPGTFRMHTHMQAALAYAMLVNPANVVEFTARIPEGLRATDIFARLAAADRHISQSAYQQALRNVSALGLPAYAHGKPEGYLYPDTYQIQPNASALSVLQQMVQSFNQEAGAVNLTQNAHPDQVIIVASLVQAEGGSVPDFPKIARVIYNRLAQGMKLQLDSTVLYGLNTYGILASGPQLQSNSPYNTYKFKGLPPGPIDSPGAAAIQAALNPAAGNWLYFVTVDPKTKLTKFTSSYTQFLEFQQELRHNIATGK